MSSVPFETGFCIPCKRIWCLSVLLDFHGFSVFTSNKQKRLFPSQDPVFFSRILTVGVALSDHLPDSSSNLVSWTLEKCTLYVARGSRKSGKGELDLAGELVTRNTRKPLPVPLAPGASGAASTEGEGFLRCCHSPAQGFTALLSGGASWHLTKNPSWK